MFAFPTDVRNDKAKQIMKDIAKLMNSNIIKKYYYDEYEIWYFDVYIIGKYSDINALIYFTIINNSIAINAALGYNINDTQRKYTLGGFDIEKYNDKPYQNFIEYSKQKFDEIKHYLLKYSSSVRNLKLNDNDFFEIFESNLKYLKKYDSNHEYILKCYIENIKINYGSIFNIYTIIKYLSQFGVYHNDYTNTYQYFKCADNDRVKYLHSKDKVLKIQLFTDNGNILTEINEYALLKYMYLHHNKLLS